MKILIVVSLSTLQLRQKSDRSIENGITSADLVQTPSASIVTINITVFEEQHNCNIFLITYILWDMAPAALMSLNQTNDRCSMSNQYPQPTTQPPRTDSCPMFFSLPTMDSKRKVLRVSFAFFQRKNLPDGRVNETVATVEELSDLWKPGTMDGIPLSVMNCKRI